METLLQRTPYFVETDAKNTLESTIKKLGSKETAGFELRPLPGTPAIDKATKSEPGAYEVWAPIEVESHAVKEKLTASGLRGNSAFMKHLLRSFNRQFLTLFPHEAGAPSRFENYHVRLETMYDYLQYFSPGPTPIMVSLRANNGNLLYPELTGPYLHRLLADQNIVQGHALMNRTYFHEHAFGGAFEHNGFQNMTGGWLIHHPAGTTGVWMPPVPPTTFHSFDLLLVRKVALQAQSNGRYVCAEGGGGREIVANRGAINQWETFYMVNCPGSSTKFVLVSSNDWSVLEPEYLDTRGNSPEIRASGSRIRESSWFELQAAGGGASYILAPSGGRIGLNPSNTRLTSGQYTAEKFKIIYLP
jgi:hypothetical protein